jgi:hypothetical protein
MTGHAAAELLGEAGGLALQARTLHAEVGDFPATVRAA